VADFQTWANGLFPPKLLVVATEQGRLETDWLDLVGIETRGTRHETRGYEGLSLGSLVSRSRVSSHGWTFPPEAVFDEDRLLAVLADRREVTRLKGVFRCEHGWIAVNRTGDGMTVKATAYRRDSRVEAFAAVPDWAGFEAAVRECIL
jgi:hypothetical protein